MLLALASANARAAQWFVQTDNVTFSPQFLTISAGDSVTFLNRGGYHNVVADDGSFRCAHGCDGDGKGGSGNASSSLWIVTRVFSEPGTVGYFCEPHGSPGSGMFGTIEVQAPTVPATPAPVGSVLLDLALGSALVALAALRLRRKDARQ
jgi:plastocyanin